MNSRIIAATAALTLLAGLGTAATGTAASGAPAAAKVKKFEVTATVSQAEPEQGDKIKIKGSVTRADKGDKVILQKRYGTSGKWKKADTDTLNGKGNFKFTEKVNSVRFRQYRVLKPGEDGIKPGHSAKLKVTVYGWRDLTSLSPVAYTGTEEVNTVNINAQAYEQSILGNGYGNAGSIAYNINRGCKRFEGRVGLSDFSQVTATGNISLTADTTLKFQNSFGLTQSQPVGLDVTGVFRLTVDWTSTNTAGTPENQSGAVIAVGSPRLLCNF